MGQSTYTFTPHRHRSPPSEVPRRQRGRPCPGRTDSPYPASRFPVNHKKKKSNKFSFAQFNKSIKQKSKNEFVHRPNRPSQTDNVACAFFLVFFSVALTFHDTYIQTRMKLNLTLILKSLCLNVLLVRLSLKFFLSVRGLILKLVFVSFAK